MKTTNCSRYEEMIYLWDELTPEEKNELQEHVKNCASCYLRWADAQTFSRTVKQLASDKIVPHNASQLTSRIMQAIIHKPRPVSWSERIENWFKITVMRYSLAMLSFILAFSFIIELTGDQTKMQDAASSAQNTVILNVSSFKQAFNNQTKNKSVFTRCRSPFKDHQAFVACVKSQLESI